MATDHRGRGLHAGKRTNQEVTDLQSFRQTKESRASEKTKNEQRVKGTTRPPTAEEQEEFPEVESWFTSVTFPEDMRPAPPVHKVGDRVYSDHNGYKEGTVTRVHVSDDPSRSHKVTVTGDTGSAPWHSYEQAWSPLHENTTVTPIKKKK